MAELCKFMSSIRLLHHLKDVWEAGTAKKTILLLGVFLIKIRTHLNASPQSDPDIVNNMCMPYTIA